MKLLFAGDCVVTTSYPVSYLGKDLLALFKQSDYNVVNLEAPITASEDKIRKIGPNLRMNAEQIALVLDALPIHAVTMANNHILDYGTAGLKDTFLFCKKHGIRTVGAVLHKYLRQ